MRLVLTHKIIIANNS